MAGIKDLVSLYYYIDNRQEGLVAAALPPLSPIGLTPVTGTVPQSGKPGNDRSPAQPMPAGKPGILPQKDK